jgi:hypothetical protein
MNNQPNLKKNSAHLETFLQQICFCNLVPKPVFRNRVQIGHSIEAFILIATIEEKFA